MPLRLRLTLLYTTLLGGTLLLFGSLVYGLVSLVLVDQVDSTLAQQAESILNVLRVNSSGQYELRMLDEFQPGDSNLVFQVWGTDRHLQFSRPRSWQSPLDPLARQIGQTMYNTTISQGTHMRVVSLPLITPRGPTGTLQVGLSLGLLDAAQRALASVLIVLALISMILAAWIARLVINRDHHHKGR
jgi:two-component system OmpR family sensor kinase